VIRASRRGRLAYAGSVVTAGTTIGGRFRIDHLLGSGGMGIVVAATHLELGHRVAIKLLRDEMAANPTVVERFLREARAVVQLRTEHVCRVMDVGRLDTGAPYIVMELLEGSDLGRVVATQPLPATTAVDYVLQACEALAEAHAAGIVHRDLKPANLFVTRRPDGGPLIKVLDFGIAKAMTEIGAQLTHSHSMLGSPGYIAPEQLQSARDVDVRTDIWALGVTLYQLLSARLPFHRANATEMAVRIVTDDPDPLDVEPALVRVVLRCLEKARDQRYPDVAALALDLVPFGGPAARALAASVGQVARRSLSASAPLPLPVSPLAATVASSPESSGAGGANHRRGVADPPAGGRRPRRWWWLAAPLVVLGVAGAAVIPRVSTRRAIAVVPLDAGVSPVGRDPGPLGAGGRVPAARDPGSVDAGARAPALRDAGPRPPPAPDRRNRSSGASAAPMTVADALAQGARQLKAACLQMTKPDTAGSVPPIAVVMCWCQRKDQARAKAAFAKLAATRERSGITSYCATQGIKLP